MSNASDIFLRTEMLIGKEALEKLRKSRVAIFGIGGVGSFTVEALTRAGVGELILIDGDNVSYSNINRQIHATTETVGMPKVEVMKERVLTINPDIKIKCFNKFYSLENSLDFFTEKMDYIVDALDDVKAKIDIISKAKERNIEIISSMGTGNKLNPLHFEVTDIFKTETDPLARKVRHELRLLGIKKLKVIYSKEKPFQLHHHREEGNIVPGSISFVPSVAGLIIASEVIKDIIFLHNFRR